MARQIRCFHWDTLETKAHAFGWEAMAIADGNNMAQVIDGLNEAKARTGNGKPIFVIMKTADGCRS
jgi:transketolase